MIVTKGGSNPVATVDGALKTYALEYANFAPIKTGTDGQIKISNAIVSDTSGSFKLGGLTITKPGLSAEFLNSGSFTVGWTYIGNAKNVTFSVQGTTSTKTFPIGKTDGTEVTQTFQVAKTEVGPVSLIATTDGTDPDTDSETITLDGISIFDPQTANAGKAKLVVDWKPVGKADVIGTNCVVKIVRPNGGLDISMKATVAAGTATFPSVNLQAPNGSSANYTIQIDTDKGYHAESTLTVKGK